MPKEVFDYLIKTKIKMGSNGEKSSINIAIWGAPITLSLALFSKYILCKNDINLKTPKMSPGKIWEEMYILYSDLVC